MDFKTDLTVFLNRTFTKEYNWEKQLHIPVADLRKAVEAKNISAFIQNIDKKQLYDFNGALELALKIKQNLDRIRDKTGGRGSKSKTDLKELKNRIYLKKASETFPDVASPSEIDSFADSNFMEIYTFFMRMSSFFIRASKQLKTDSWESKYPFEPIAEDELARSNYQEEYQSFLKHFRVDRVYELMKMSQEFLGFTTLNHVLGVHALAMTIARQLADRGFDIDLGIISATSINHDIGKFGCKGEELKRIAYLHYYYTKEWFDRHKLPTLSHVATNHGTWDLENIRLPIETMILIYSDFCVKNKKYPDGSLRMTLFPIDEAFEVIKNMLDNLDEQKIKRYETVYEKLKDLDDMFSLLDIKRDLEFPDKNPDRLNYKLKYNHVQIVEGTKFGDIFSLLPSNEIALAYKNLSVSSNFRVLNLLRDVKSLSHILEQARLEKNWKDLRTYIRIIENYSDYFTHEQRLITIDFLIELLSHREDDIRYHSAILIAEQINNIDTEFHKELPKHVVPDRKILSMQLFKRVLSLLEYDESDPEESLEHKERRIYNTTLIVRQLFHISPMDKIKKFKSILFEYLPGGSNFIDKPLSILYLAEIMLATINCYSLVEVKEIQKFILRFLNHSERATRLMVMELLSHILIYIPEKFWADENGQYPRDILKVLSQLVNATTTAAESNVVDDIMQHISPKRVKSLEFWPGMLGRMEYITGVQRKNFRNIFLDNFKTKISWVEKKANCDFLSKYAHQMNKELGDRFLTLETAGHFANILKVSRVEGTRFRAGQRLLELLPLLEANQVNEIAIELLRSLEQDDEGHTQYIPRVLGQVLVRLPYAEFKEILEDMNEGLRSMRVSVKQLLLKSLGHTLVHLSGNDTESQKEKTTILAMLLKAVFNNNEQVTKSAYNVIGSLIFHRRSIITEAEKRMYLETIGKKFLTLLRYRTDSIISLFYASTCLNQIYKFISSQEKQGKPLKFTQHKKIAFVPGTYDPFSDGHRELVKIAADSGFEVQVQVDEFSWSKRTLPRLLRKHLVRMSIAGLYNVYLFPSEPPLNLGNSDNLNGLVKLFSPRKISLAVGSDVIVGASAYCNKPPVGKKSVYNLHHLIFKRAEKTKGKDEDSYDRQIRRIKKLFKNGYQEFALDTDISLVSSSRIRKTIEKGRSIDDMVDPAVANFIQERRLYVKTPEYKSEMGRSNWAYRLLDKKNIRKNDLDKIVEVYRDAFKHHPARHMVTKAEILKYFSGFLKRQNARILILENKDKNFELIGFTSFFEIENVRIISLVQSFEVSEVIREKTAGPLVYTSILAIKRSYQHRNIAADLKTRAALMWIEKGYMFSLSKINYSLINNNGPFSAQERRLLELNEEMGYQLLETKNEETIDETNYIMGYMIVNLQRPVLVINDLIDQFKQPYRSDKKLIRIIHNNQKLLLSVMRDIYPDQLLLRINNRELVNAVLEKLQQTVELSVPSGTKKSDGLSEQMAVLIGQVLGREIVPQMVTKALHTERTIDRKGQKDYFMPYPYYTGVPDQLATMKNFNRSAILADLFSLSGGTLLNVIDIARDINFPIDKVVVGIITGRAREILLARGIKTDHLIYLPTLTNWFNLRHFYPYIGGETINQPFYYRRVIIESMNYIFPYRRANQLKNVSRDNLLTLSRVCLLGSFDIFSYLEDKYLETNKRELTLLQLPEIMEDARRPISSEAFIVDWNRRITEIIEGDLEQIDRFYV